MTTDPYALDVPAFSPEQASADVLAPDKRPAPPAQPPAAPVATPPAKEPQRGSTERTVKSVAIGGKQAEVAPLPDRPAWPALTDADLYVPEEEFDSSDLSVINREMNRCRARLFEVSQSQRTAQRSLRDAELLYNRQMRRALVSVSGGTADTRRAVAEMECERYENDLVVGQQIVEELRKRAQDVRDDLKAVENLSHNARAQMAIQ